MQVNLFWRDGGVGRGRVEILYDFAREARRRFIADNLKTVAAVADFDMQAAFQLTQVLVKLATETG